MKYAKYKPTGIAWLPEVPEEWEMVRLKNVLRERVEKSSTGLEEPLSMSQKRGIVPTREMDVVPNAASSYVGAKKVYVDDIVFNKLKAHLGVFAISAYDGLVSPDYAVYTSSGLISRKYLEYLFHTPLYITEFRRKSTGIAIGLTRLYTKDLYSIYGVCPPTGVQQAIVAFLDEKCGKVDRLVAAKEKEVALLKELKQSMIAEAVTRGVCSNRRLVASGIPWLPEVPEGWEVKKVRQLAREGKTKNKGNVEKNVLSLSYGRIIRKKDIYSGLAPTDFATYQIVEKDYVVLRLTDLQNDHRSLRCGLVHERGIITSAYVSLIPQNVLPEYLYLALHTCDLNKVFYSMGGGLRQSMNFADVGNIFIPLPPHAEQREIVAQIEAKAAKIDAAVAGLEREIAALKEYKQRLIADVVTGQRRVA